jgi:hypothetical protein
VSQYEDFIDKVIRDDDTIVNQVVKVVLVVLAAPYVSKEVHVKKENNG